MSADASAAFACAVRLLTRRDHSEQEIRRKLEQRGYGPTAVAGAIEELARLNYLNDQRFAAAWVEHAVARRGFCGTRLEVELQRRGIAREIATEAIENAMAGREETELLHDLLERKFPRFIPGSATTAERRRIFEYLRRRGFGASHILKAMRFTEEP